MNQTILISILVICILALLLSIFLITIYLINSKKSKENKKNEVEIMDSFIELKQKIENLNSTFLVLTNTVQTSLENHFNICENRQSNLQEKITNNDENKLKELKKYNEDSISLMEKKTQILQNLIEDKSTKQLKENNDNFFSFNEKMSKKFDELQKQTNEKINSMLNNFIENANDQIQKINNEINEHFKSKLQKDLDQHFKMVSESMDSLKNNITKFESWQSNVSDLNKAFNNSKTRGNFGELNLENLLRNNFSSQDIWDKQVNLSKSNEAVDFVIKMKNNNNKLTYLPIDSKFPLENYLKIVDAKNIEDKEKAKKAFFDDIKSMAKSISEKYIIEGMTTDYAILYLPTEAIYAEAVSQMEEISKIWYNYHVIVTGPSTIMPSIRNFLIYTQSQNIMNNIKSVQELMGYINKNYESIISHMEKVQKSNLNVNKEIQTAMRIATTVNNKIKLANKKAIFDLNNEENQEDDNLYLEVDDDSIEN
ncbi:DNA recombination protein RmuC [[Mycoplasma] anseris]|nr:DNA recombination protein RmuC [[Mycoplasma] anseris]